MAQLQSDRVDAVDRLQEIAAVEGVTHEHLRLDGPLVQLTQDADLLLLAIACPDPQADVVARIRRGEQVHGEDASVDLIVSKHDGDGLTRAGTDFGILWSQPAWQEGV